jgi:hypothetical protein
LRGVVLTLVGLLLGGCISQEVAPAAIEALPGRMPLPATLVDPILHPLAILGMSPGEPNIAGAPDGTVYVSAINDIYRSDDGGATFELAHADLDGGGDGDLAITPDGALHWLGLFAKDAPIPYYASTDQGKTWSKAVDLSNKTGSDREWIDARHDSPTLYAAWRDGDDDGIVAFRSSFDGGKTWNERVSMSEDAVGGPLVHGPVAGQAYQAQATFETTTGAADASVRLARTHDHGVTWEILPIITPRQGAQFGLIGFPFSIFPVVAVDDNGTLYVVYSIDQGMIPGAPKPLARSGVYLQVSHDEGDTWSEPRLLSSPDHAALMPFITAGATGRIAVAWYENTYGLPSENLPDLWHVKLLEGIDEDKDTPQEKVVQLTEAPNHIGSICTSGVGCLLTAGDRSLLDFIEVALTASGQPVVTWASTDHPQQGFVRDVRIMARGVETGTPLR